MAIENLGQYLQAGNAQLTQLSGAELQNAEASLLAVSPFLPGYLPAQKKQVYTRSLAYFTVLPDGTPQLVIPPPAPAPLPTANEGIVPDPPAAQSRRASRGNPVPPGGIGAGTDSTGGLQPAPQYIPPGSGLRPASTPPAKSAPPPATTTTAPAASSPVIVSSGEITAPPSPTQLAESATAASGPTPTTSTDCTSALTGSDTTTTPEQRTTQEQVQSALTQFIDASPTWSTIGGGAGACIPAPTVSCIGIWVTVDDFLYVTVTPLVATSGLTLITRVLDCAGVLHYGSLNLDGAALGTSTTYIVSLTTGYLLDASVTAPCASIPLGGVQAVMGIQHSAQPCTPATNVLGSGYVTGPTGVSYPSLAGGAPSAPSAPSTLPPASVRGSGLTVVSTPSQNVFFPAGSQAGDLCILWIGADYAITLPSGWTTQYSSSTGTGYWIAVLNKVLTSGDISTGFVTLSYGGAATTEAGILTFIGPTHWNPNTSSAFGIQVNSSGTGTLTTSGSGVPASGNVALYWASIRAGVIPTVSRGTILQSLSNASGGGAAICGETLRASGQVTANISFAGNSASGGEAILIIQL